VPRDQAVAMNKKSSSSDALASEDPTRTGSRPRSKTGSGAPVPAGESGSSTVRLVVNASGDVVGVTDKATGKSLAYTISMSWDDAEDAPALFEALASKVSTSLHGNCARSCPSCSGRGCLSGMPLAALSAWKRNAGGCLVFVPLFNCRNDASMRFPTGCAYVLPADIRPKHSFFPFNMEYCTGMTLVELENKLDDRGLVLTTDYFTTKDALQRRDMFIATAYGDTDPDALPGVVLHDTLKALEPFTSSKYPRDPLLRTFRPDWTPEGVRLGNEDYCFIGSSTWGDVSASTREVAGHANGQVHFYLVVKYSLPPEVVDQVRGLLGGCWGAAPPTPSPAGGAAPHH
jgi:hypothetical protein